MYSLGSPEILNRIPFWWFIVWTCAVAQHTIICCLKFCYVMKFEGFGTPFWEGHIAIWRLLLLVILYEYEIFRSGCVISIFPSCLLAAGHISICICQKYKFIVLLELYLHVDILSDSFTPLLIKQLYRWSPAVKFLQKTLCNHSTVVCFSLCL